MSIAYTLNTTTPEETVSCYHCGEIISSGTVIKTVINGEERRMCCQGCRAIAETIAEYGLTGYYHYRTTLPSRPDQDNTQPVPDLTLYDRTEFQASFVQKPDQDSSEASLIMEGIVCPACVWLNESRLRSIPGIINANVNYTTGKAIVRWKHSQIRLSDILENIYRLGYRAYPYDPYKRQFLRDRENKTQLLRLGIAGLFGMQVMMIAIAFYTDIGNGLDPQHRVFLSWISLILTLPVMLFSARPFFANAWRALNNRRMDMDQPVALGIGLAFLASVWSTFSNTGPVYYDSVTMLVFFLLAGRYLEFTARNRAALHLDILEKIIPAMTTRLDLSGPEIIAHTVPVIDLRPGDVLLIKPGEVLPVDGIVMNGKTCVNESIITGESAPVMKQEGDALRSGSTNTDTPVQIRVTATGPDTTFSRICRLVEQAQTTKPRVTLLADRIAGWFLSGVLLITAGAAFYWWHADHSQWLPVTVAILVVTCPCALSLATPVSIAVTINSLLGKGVAVINSNALQTMTRITHMIFDKTGTLTVGKPVIHRIVSVADVPETEVIRIVQALEACSEHPLAHAFRNLDRTHAIIAADQSQNYPGAGISGVVNGRKYFIGTPGFIRELSGSRHPLPASLHGTDEPYILLADERKLVAVFIFDDELRPDAASVVRDFGTEGITCMILSGDSAENVSRVAAQTAIADARGRLKPEDKLAVIASLQQQQAVVAMVGDGINDMPVLARADVALAMGNGSDMTRQQADFILLGSRLSSLTEIHKLARRCMHIIRQNIIWAVAYNLLALPAAVSGLLTPWMAALGMSVSSLLVVLNSLRIDPAYRVTTR